VVALVAGMGVARDKKSGGSMADAVIAAPVPVVVLVVIRAAFRGPLEITQLFGAAFLMYLAGILATLAFGLPLFLLMRRMDQANKWTAAAVGLAVGYSISAATSWPNTLPPGDVLLFSFAGLLSGLTFWLTWSAGGKIRVQDGSRDADIHTP
jgi:hypothetical protein